MKEKVTEIEDKQESLDSTKPDSDSDSPSPVEVNSSQDSSDSAKTSASPDSSSSTKQAEKVNAPIKIITVGRRKTSIARVSLSSPSQSERVLKVNGREHADYFTIDFMRRDSLAPLALLDLEERFDIHINVSGGGLTGQAGAIRLGIARALKIYEDNHRASLKQAGYLRRDPRMVERKKYGLHKARRSTQFSKR